MKAPSPGTRLATFGLPIMAFAAMSAVSLVIFRGMSARDSLESRNDSERTMNALLSSLRDHDDFGQAIESVGSLRDKVIGVAAYAADGTRLYAWGEVPERPPYFPPEPSREGDPVSTYVDLPRTDSAALVFKVFKGGPPPPPRDAASDAAKGDAPVGGAAANAAGDVSGDARGDASGADRKPVERAAPDAKARDGRALPTFFAVLKKADHVYLELRKPAYWRKRRIRLALFPFVEAALAGLVAFVAHILSRNAEYRRRIEEQKNLVALGAAASTLAHEIKNPLSSIRLQTRILEKTWPSEAMREIRIINDEVERLSAMSRRVGDYLRDPAGQPAPVDAAEMASEVGRRLCGRDILVPARGGEGGSGDSDSSAGASQAFDAGGSASAPASRRALALIDAERLRSVLDNLVRNALESYGDGAEGPVEAEVGTDGRRVTLRIMDRGKGVDEATAARAFDLFFTTKSRGSGIGLSICKRFVEAAGGSIRLEPRPGGGTVAAVELRAAEEARP